MPRIHIDKNVVTPSGEFQKGERCDVSTRTARDLVDGGFATPLNLWLIQIADEEGFDVFPKKLPPMKKLTKMLDF